MFPTQKNINADLSPRPIIVNGSLCRSLCGADFSDVNMVKTSHLCAEITSEDENLRQKCHGKMPLLLIFFQKKTNTLALIFFFNYFFLIWPTHYFFLGAEVLTAALIQDDTIQTTDKTASSVTNEENTELTQKTKAIKRKPRKTLAPEDVLVPERLSKRKASNPGKIYIKII